jgi:hypothetical protein
VKDTIKKYRVIRTFDGKQEYLSGNNWYSVDNGRMTEVETISKAKTWITSWANQNIINNLTDITRLSEYARMKLMIDINTFKTIRIEECVYHLTTVNSIQYEIKNPRLKKALVRHDLISEMKGEAKDELE